MRKKKVKEVEVKKLPIYKKMTFCSYYEKCYDAKDCPRLMTDEVIADAKKVNERIVSYPRKPACFKKMLKSYI